MVCRARLIRAIATIGALGALVALARMTSRPDSTIASFEPIQATGNVNPHGGFSGSTDLCRQCHTVHKAPGTPILSAATERQTCYQCHGIAGGATENVQAEFGETANIGVSTKVSFHPVPQPSDGVQIYCSSCHTPHQGATDDTRLLRASFNGLYTYSPPSLPIGNVLCYSCHGATSSLPAPFGDHTAFDAGIHNTSPGVPAPASGSGIKCLACHSAHASDYPKLTTADQEALCFTCHSQATPNTSGGSNPYNAFTAATNDYTTGNVRIYHHPIATADQAGGTRKVECASCHNTHVNAGTDTTGNSKIINPLNMTSPWIVTWGGPGMVSGNIDTWCESCHVSPATTAPISATSNVAYDVRLVDDGAHDKFSITNWGVSQHKTAGLTCTACHDVHGSSNAFMFRSQMVDMSGSVSNVVNGYDGTLATAGQMVNMCTTCHALPAVPDGDPPHGSGTVCTDCHYHGSDTGKL